MKFGGGAKKPWGGVRAVLTVYIVFVGAILGLFEKSGSESGFLCVWFLGCNCVKF